MANPPQAIFDIHSPLDWKQINPAGMDNPETAGHLSAAAQATEKLATDLENRFKNPNWFKVAAGFAKPQLGGFLASLGSANEALGEWEEGRRMVAPTVSRMRAEIAAGMVPFSQKKQAEAILRESGYQPTGPQAGKVATLAQGVEFGPTAGMNITRADIENARSILETTGDLTALANKYGTDRYMAVFEATLRAYPDLKNKVKNVISPASGNDGATSSASGTTPDAASSRQSPAQEASGKIKIPGVPLSESRNMPLDQWLERSGETGAAKVAAVTEKNKEYAGLANTSSRILEDAKTVYQLAADPELAPAFAAFEGKGPGALLGRILESQDVSGVLGEMRSTLRPNALSKSGMEKFNKLEGALSSLNTRLVKAWGNNQTDKQSMIEAAMVPNIKNQQKAFLAGIARIGSDFRTNLDMNDAYQRYINSPEGDISKWETTNDFKNVRKKAQERTSAILSGTPSVEPPSFFTLGQAVTRRPSASSFREEYERRRAARGQ